MRITCQRIGRPPISTSGFGRAGVCSRSRVPRPPQRMTTGSSIGPNATGVSRTPGFGRAAELEEGVPGPQHHPERAVDVVAPPGEGGAPAMQAIRPAAARADDVLRDAALRPVALEVVVVPGEDEPGVAHETVPERVEVGRAAVGAGAVARAVHERDAAGARP